MSRAAVLAAEVFSSGETVAFWILGPIALAGAIGMVLSRNAIHSALWLVLTMLSLGAIYFVQQAPFLGAVQIIVYTCLLYTSPSPRDRTRSRMPSSA